MEKKDLKGLVVDLRDNAGGLFESSIEVADQLLPEGMITYTEDRSGKKETFNSDEHCTKLKYVVLINGKTASAAEIVSAAVKDSKKGKLVGTRSYGKGVVQGTIPFDDESAMTLTIMQYFSPKGKEIHKVGVKPDYEVKNSGKKDQDKQLEKALEVLKSEKK